MNDSNKPKPSRGIQRREILKRGALGLGAIAAAGPALAGVDLHGDAWSDDLEPMLGEDSALRASSCTITPSNVQGPFWQDLALMRQDISEGLAGFPVTLIIQVIDSSTCSPVSGAVVDIWHDSPDGRYSGFQSEGTLGLTFLRGIQVTGPTGLVRFETVYPGWYTGRTPHIHLKVNPTSSTELTTQLYLDDGISERLFALVPPYDARGVSPTNNSTDAFYLPELQADVRPKTGTRGLIVSKRIVIQ